jgi:hypothetical protein
METPAMRPYVFTKAFAAAFLAFTCLTVLLHGDERVLTADFPQSAETAQTEFVVRERIGDTWRNELVTCPFEAPEGACHRRSLRLAGPRGSEPVQLVEVIYWDESRTSVRSAKAAFFVDLDPYITLIYKLRYGAEPVEKRRRGR